MAELSKDEEDKLMKAIIEEAFKMAFEEKIFEMSEPYEADGGWNYNFIINSPEGLVIESVPFLRLS